MNARKLFPVLLLGFFNWLSVGCQRNFRTSIASGWIFAFVSSSEHDGYFKARGIIYK
jgi:hypothetical protein